MEDDLKNFKMEDDLKNFKMEDDLKNVKIPNLMCNLMSTQLNRRQPQKFQNGKTNKKIQIIPKRKLKENDKKKCNNNNNLIQYSLKTK